MNHPVSIKPVIVPSAGQPESTQARKADLPQFKVELDDRAILLPDGKVLHHIIMSVDEGGHIAFDGVFAFNRTGRHPRLLRLSLADTGALAAELVNAVYAAKTAFVFGQSLKITITVVANGYKMEFHHEGEVFDLFLSTGVIWRFIKGLLLAIDAASPGVAN
ncbi:MAG: hypothetical protein ACOVN4_06730 [Bosea sp. (in: a-proteobacteria)]|jgi:hypothetical protein